MQGISLFTAVYAFARQRGLLDTRLGRSLFIAAYFQYKKHLEDPFAGLVEKRPELFRGGHIIDAGANIGYCSALFSRVLDPGRSVFAFEPEPFNVSLLEHVIRTRKLARVVPIQAAVGAAEGEIRLQLNPQHHGDHRIVAGGGQPAERCITVPLLSLDAFLERQQAATPVCFIKIDVQGYEQAVCQGAEQTLARNPECRVVLEYMPEAIEALGFRPAYLLDWFQQRGYSAYTVHKDGGITNGFPADIGATGYVDLLFSLRPMKK
jgi:FkbM family methyltransferase